MISKKRLEELIKEGATIYYADRDVKFPIPIFLNEEDFVRGKELSHEESCVRDNILLEDLYEEQKQAEWALKYHTTRTEELDLPMWEDFKSGKEIKFIDFYGHHYTFEMKNEDYIWLTFRTIFDDSEIFVDFEELATEENYIKACDLCLKLFKGEENGN